MKIALASPHHPKSIDDAIVELKALIKDAAQQSASIICFPETYIPGYPLDIGRAKRSAPEMLEDALTKVCAIAKENSIAIILPTDWYEADKFLNVAFVISDKGKILGYQSKNQLDPTEDKYWDAGTQRQLFEINNLKLGITICHEGFRYPESVRWAARAGAAIVFHPHFTGSDIEGVELKEWCHADNPYYEKAIMMRALENTIYFAGVNYATRYQESATAFIAPDGKCIMHQQYGKAGVIVADIDTAKATGLLAKRFNTELY
jgi:predicted amidohydrolase